VAYVEEGMKNPRPSSLAYDQVTMSLGLPLRVHVAVRVEQPRAIRCGVASHDLMKYGILEIFILSFTPFPKITPFQQEIH